VRQSTEFVVMVHAVPNDKSVAARQKPGEIGLAAVPCRRAVALSRSTQMLTDLACPPGAAHGRLAKARCPGHCRGCHPRAGRDRSARHRSRCRCSSVHRAAGAGPGPVARQDHEIDGRVRAPAGQAPARRRRRKRNCRSRDRDARPRPAVMAAGDVACQVVRDGLATSCEHVKSGFERRSRAISARPRGATRTSTS
jgi:hypothetical protein